MKTVLAARKADDTALVSALPGGKSIEELLSKEWLLTNERGSYASSTIICCNTRGYHGLLVGSLNPPTNRIMALSNCMEMVISEQKVFNLSTFEFSDKFAPQGFDYIKRFQQDTGVHFYYELDNLKLTKSIYLLRDSDTVALVYDFSDIEEQVEFVLRPFVALRDFHALQKSYAPLCSIWLGGALLVRYDMLDSCELLLSCPSASFEKDQQWWFNFVYRNDRERGQAFTEDLWTPGFFKCCIDSPTTISFWANLSARSNLVDIVGADIDTVRRELLVHQSSVLNGTMKKKDKRLAILYLAADRFVTKRQTDATLRSSDSLRSTSHTVRTTILAGFPWFADWGRDAFIALPGLLLSTGRFEEARSVLTTFAQAADEGMIPNRFDDNSDTTYFNSVDASLWFINAAFQYLNATGDSKTFTEELLPVIRWVMDSYYKGTRFGIHADDDELITAGSSDTQLTWMDAKCDGVAFTPRCGKAVEVNALWYNAICNLAQFYAQPVVSRSNPRDIDAAKHYIALAGIVAASFCELFWNKSKGYLNDCILPDGSVDDSLRPNQIFAVSLAFSPLSAQQQKSVVDVVQKELLTPFGLRTLNVQDSRYKSIYTGPQRQRDEAYHQGTVWPFLIGPFVEAYLKVNGFSRKSKKKAAEFIEPLLQHLTDEGCLGNASEIFDGDAPHMPRGCFAQAWSVGELIRAYRLIYG
jgi:predicted glycogen debranching enzyme